MLYYRWRKNPVPEVFVRRYKPTQPSIPPQLIEEFLNRLAGERIVPASVALASMRADWQMGRPLPGLGTWREYLRKRHGDAASRRVPPPFPFGRASFYWYLGGRDGCDYHRRISQALSAQRELARFLDFIEQRRCALARALRHEPLSSVPHITETQTS